MNFCFPTTKLESSFSISPTLMKRYGKNVWRLIATIESLKKADLPEGLFQIYVEPSPDRIVVHHHVSIPREVIEQFLSSKGVL